MCRTEQKKSVGFVEMSYYFLKLLFLGFKYFCELLRKFNMNNEFSFKKSVVYYFF